MQELGKSCAKVISILDATGDQRYRRFPNFTIGYNSPTMKVLTVNFDVRNSLGSILSFRKVDPVYGVRYLHGRALFAPIAVNRAVFLENICKRWNFTTIF